MSKYEILKCYEPTLRRVEDIIGVRSTSNLIINKLCFEFIPGFVGTFPSVLIPRMKNNECCIVNTDSHTKPGTHWCCLFKYQDKFYFYDSFARDYKKLSPFWYNKRWINTNKPCVDQSINEFDCGPRSVAWLFTFQKYKLKCINIL